MSQLSAQEVLALSELAESVRGSLGERVQEIRLFGSRARGEGHAESDLDVLIRLTRLTREDRRWVQDLAFDIGFARGLSISPLLVDSQQWRRDWPLGQAIERDGITL